MSNSTAPPPCVLALPSVFYRTLIVGGAYQGIAMVFGVFAIAAATSKYFEKRTRFWLLFWIGSILNFIKDVSLIISIVNSPTVCGNFWVSMTMFYFNGVCYLMAVLIPMTVRLWRFFISQVKTDTDSLRPKIIRWTTMGICIGLYLLSAAFFIARTVNIIQNWASGSITFAQSNASPYAITTVIPRIQTSVCLILSLFSEAMFVKNFLSKQVFTAIRQKNPVALRGLLLFALMVLVDVVYAAFIWVDLAYPLGNIGVAATKPDVFMYGFLINFTSQVTVSFDFWASEQIISTYIPVLISIKNSGGHMLEGKHVSTSERSTTVGKSGFTANDQESGIIGRTRMDTESHH
ncbi:hypothetical protein HK102_000177 [Quaeritorhiza haematococci]|nr:hypothetical protein HK102_000177 [Quaeritorhiza haematococci]